MQRALSDTTRPNWKDADTRFLLHGMNFAYLRRLWFQTVFLRGKQDLNQVPHQDGLERTGLKTWFCALQVVPLQISLIPILRDYQRIGLSGSYLGIWLAHAGFGLPLATYMMFNYISGIPRSILESIFMDGASHFTTFVRLILPLSVPAIASFAIFRFIWVWNDMLVALVFLSGAAQKAEVVTARLMNMAGTRGTDWHLLTAGAFVSMILPLGVFLGLQKFFVKGLLAGSVKE